jgi:hypothetical protein
VLRENLKTDENAYARGHAASGLGSIGSDDEIPVLMIFFILHRRDILYRKSHD